MADLSYTQIATLLNSVFQQATGQGALAAIDSSQFVSVAQTVLKTGYDNVIQALSQVMMKTIFRVRPYNAKFKGLMVDSQKFGNHVRKINYLHQNAVVNDAQPHDPSSATHPTYPLEDGNSIDQYIINKPKAIQTNFYGGATYARFTTKFMDQLDIAFSSPEELNRFWSSWMVELSNMIEQDHEITSRGAIANLVGAVLVGGTGYQKVHLITEYNTETGLSLTSTTVKQPANFKAFIQWMIARTNKAAKFMGENTVMYHQNLTAGNFLRFTPMNNMKTFFLDEFKTEMETMAYADTFHDTYLKLANNEGVSFWQSPLAPSTIKVTPNILNADGSVSKYENEDTDDTVTAENLIGIMMDEEAAGMTVISEWNKATPFNARGGYSNQWYHWTDRWWNDPTENVILFFLD